MKEESHEEMKRNAYFFPFPAVKFQYWQKPKCVCLSTGEPIAKVKHELDGYE